ncbi:phage tail tape measure protein [Bradyrhizobium lablabi]|uniref:phage tail tape measure protein n=1 Tax=Bradyrhizobium lablabi TaxID=722472 RepID=UPI00090A6638|nr:phage tail tape measure protein, lambda family [Bradyrhizobium lablabi]
MTVQLSSLRVSADMDSSGYQAGAKGIVAANDAAGTSSQRYIDAQGRLVTATKSAVTGFGQSQAALMAFQAQLLQSSQAMQGLSGEMAALNDNADSWGNSVHRTGLEVVQAAAHLRTLGLAAYALSPAFRDLVNPAIAASVRALGPAAASAAGTMIGVLSPALALVGRIALPVGIAVESFKAMTAITELGAEKVTEFNRLADNAGGAGVSTNFFQQQAAGAKEFGIDADLATDALKKFRQIDTAQLGGSAFDQRLSQLTQAGNFSGNSGIAALKQATDVEARYRAAAVLIDQAMDSGQRLAALDLASKFLPPEMLNRLRASGTTLKELQATADGIRPADIVDQAEIGYAIELKRRLDDANEVISNKFKPVQKDLTQLGLNYQESWVTITEIMAGAVTKGNDLYTALKGIPGLFAQAGSASFWTKLTDYTGKLGLNSDPASLGLVMNGQPGYNDDTARNALAARLRNPTAVQQAMLQATTVQSAIRRDASINPTSPKDDTNDKVDAAINTLRRHVEQQNADTRAMGLGVEALARFRAEAAETAAVQANGGKITQAQAAQFELLKTRAADAAVALEKARIATSINFSRNTAFLTPEDVQIASELKGLYPDVATALNSAQASQIRFNNAVKEGSSAFQNSAGPALLDFETGVKSGGDALKSFEQQFVRSLLNMVNQMLIFAPIARAFQGLLTGGINLTGAGFNPIAGVTGSANGNIFSGGNVIPFALGGIVDRPVMFPMANGAGLMGEAGPEAVMPLRRGPDGKLGVTTSGVGGSASRGIGDIHFNGGIQINVPEGTSPDNAAAIGRAVRESMTQVVDERILYHTRQRGRLAS